MFLDAAALYVSLGFKVLPLAAGCKLPALKGGHGFKDATDEVDQIERWARRFPDANIGIATGEGSGLVVIDIDPRNGGTASICALAGTGKVFPPCPTVRSGNGGKHLYFAHPVGLSSSKGKLGPGIDVKSTGGYVVAPPSIIRPSDGGPGGEYIWITRPSLPLPPLPLWARELLTPRTKPEQRFEQRLSSESAVRSLEGIARRAASAAVGERNNILNWAAHKAGELVRERKIDTGLAEARLIEAGLSAGLPLPEVMRTVRSGLGAGERS